MRRSLFLLWDTPASPHFPAPPLDKDWSGAGSFSLMLRTADRVYLLTGPGRTTAVPEMRRSLPYPGDSSTWLCEVGKPATKCVGDRMP